MTSILESFGNNSLAMITLLIVIPTLLLGTAYLFRRLESRERLLAIEKGVYQPISADEGYRRTRRLAIVPCRLAERA